MEPQEPVRPAFDKAADRQAAWRKQQEAALNEQQKKEYAGMRKSQNDRLREHDRKFQEDLHKLIDAEKRRLLERPAPALRMLPGQRLKDGWAEQKAKANVNDRHEVERKSKEEDFQRERDDFLRQAERDRQPPDLSAVFKARAEEKERGQEHRRDRGRERER